MWRALSPLRSFCTSQAVKISGLKFIPNFVNLQTQKDLLRESLDLHDAVVNNAKDKEFKKVQTYLSKQHNLRSDEHYKLLHLSFPNNVNLDCQYFEEYGEDGHQLTYFIQNKNIPQFIKLKLISEMEKLDEVRNVQIMKAKKTPNSQGLTWNFTYNIYGKRSENPNLIAGFPFHIDVPSNGEVTAIFTLVSSATLEMRKKGEIEASHSIQLTPGSLFLLSGESRWDWEHRVVSKTLEESENSPVIGSNGEEISRVSLVLGCL